MIQLEFIIRLFSKTSLIVEPLYPTRPSVVAMHEMQILKISLCLRDCGEDDFSKSKIIFNFVVSKINCPCKLAVIQHIVLSLV